MNFHVTKGNRYRISIEEYVKAERQLKAKFLCMKARMTSQEYFQYVEDLRVEATDYWFGAPVESLFYANTPALCEFGFMSAIDAIGFKLRWTE